MVEEKQLELKRVVMVKALVTEAFKDNLIKELDRALKNIENQEGQMSAQAQSYMEGLKSKGDAQKATDFKRQFQDEKNRLTMAKSDIFVKIEEAKKLVIGTEFVQGPLEGPVTVGIGDNLYKKVGGAEILVKDGVILEIRGID